MVEKITSYDAATAGSAANEVFLEYNHAGLPDKEYQEHSGAKDGSTPYVHFSRDITASRGEFTKGLRPISLRYPVGRLVHYTYGSSGSTADAINRLDAIKDDSGGSPGDSLAVYSYLGRSFIIQADYPQPDLRFDLAHGGGSDPYEGPTDRFGRVTDLLWYDYGSSTDAVRIQHGYDRASNRLCREDPVAAANSKDFDEFYSRDGSKRLTDLERGNLNGSKTGITGTPEWEEDWTLDPTGNWSGYVQKTSGSTDLNQTRTSNVVNQITGISETVGDSWITPTYDRSGNTQRIMQPDDPESYYTLTWDAWNRLVKVSDGATTIAEYEYDGRNFRVVVKSYDGGILDETRHAYYDHRWRCLEERVDSSSDADRQFIWGSRYVDDLVARERDTSEPADGVLDERLYALQDSNWSVVGVADTGGRLLERYQYTAFGVPTVLTGSFGARGSRLYAWEHLFTGRPWESGTFLYNYRIRNYDPRFGRFLVRDPLGYSAGMHEYNYVGNRPIGMVDPLGLAGMDSGHVKQIFQCFFISLPQLHLNPRIDFVEKPVDLRCMVYMLRKLYDDAVIRAGSREIGLGAIFAPLQAVAQGWLAKLTTSIVHSAIKQFMENDLSEEELADLIFEAIKTSTGGNKAVELATNIAKKLAKSIMANAIGECRDRSYTLNEFGGEKGEQIQCQFFVCAEVEKGVIGRWNIFGACSYKCIPYRNNTCCCGESVAFTLHKASGKGGAGWFASNCVGGKFDGEWTRAS